MQQGLSAPEFYGGLVFKLEKNVSMAIFLTSSEKLSYVTNILDLRDESFLLGVCVCVRVCACVCVCVCVCRVYIIFIIKKNYESRQKVSPEFFFEPHPQIGDKSL